MPSDPTVINMVSGKTGKEKGGLGKVSLNIMLITAHLFVSSNNHKFLQGRDY